MKENLLFLIIALMTAQFESQQPNNVEKGFTADLFFA